MVAEEHMKVAAILILDYTGESDHTNVANDILNRLQTNRSINHTYIIIRAETPHVFPHTPADNFSILNLPKEFSEPYVTVDDIMVYALHTVDKHDVLLHIPIVNDFSNQEQISQTLEQFKAEFYTKDGFTIPMSKSQSKPVISAITSNALLENGSIQTSAITNYEASA